jgi:hypothetical protein
MVTSVMNCATLQFEVAVAAGVFVTAAEGMGVMVARGVGLAVSVKRGVALNRASTVCAAAVASASSGLLEGRLHAPKNNMRIIETLKRRRFLFIASPSVKNILPQDTPGYIPRLSQGVR